MFTFRIALLLITMVFCLAVVLSVNSGNENTASPEVSPAATPGASRGNSSNQLFAGLLRGAFHFKVRKCWYRYE